MFLSLATKAKGIELFCQECGGGGEGFVGRREEGEPARQTGKHVIQRSSNVGRVRCGAHWDDRLTALSSPLI